MAEYNEIGLMRGGRVENIDTDGNIFTFDQIKIGGLAGTQFNGTNAANLFSLQNGSDIGPSLHHHDTRYYTQTQLSDTGTFNVGAELIGIDAAHSWNSISPTLYNLDEALKQIDAALGSVSSEFDELLFRITKDGDSTAKLRFDLTDITTGQVRKIIMPDFDVDLGNITTTDYVDNALSLALSGLSPKLSVNIVTIPRDWNPTPMTAFIGLLVDGINAHNQFITLYEPDSLGGKDYVFYFNNTGAPITPPATGVGGTFEVPILPGDTDILIAGKFANSVNTNTSTIFTCTQYPLGGLQTVETVRIDTVANGLTEFPTASTPPSGFFEVNNLDYERTFTRGLDGVGLSFSAGELTLTGLRANFLNVAPSIDNVDLDVGKRILIKEIPGISPDSRFNGIWECTVLLSTTSAKFIRPLDADGESGFPSGSVDSEIYQGVYTFATEGFFNFGTGWVMVSPGGINVNSDPQLWTQFRGNQQLTGSDLIFINDLGEITIGPIIDGELITGDDAGRVIKVDTKPGTSHILSSFLDGLLIKNSVITDAMIAPGGALDESITFFNNTNITGAEAETLTNGSNADALHVHNTTFVSEGSNLYFTEARVRASLLTGLNVALTGDITGTDSVLTAFGKLQNSIDDLDANRALRSLSNLTSVAINTSLLPATTNTIDLGSSLLKFKDGYFAGKLTVDGGIDPIWLQIKELASDTTVPNQSLWVRNSGRLLEYKDNSAVTHQVTLNDVAQTLTNKTMNFTGGVNNITITTTQVTEGDNLYYTTGRFDTRFATKTTSDLTEGTNLYYTDGRFDTRLATKTTDDLTEGATNKYYASSLFDTDFGNKDTDDLAEGATNRYYSSSLFDTDFGNKTTDDLTEGATNRYYSSSLFDTDFSNKTTDDLSEGATNLYYTETRFDSSFSGKSTSDLSEGSNLYFTETRVRETEITGFTTQYGAITGTEDILDTLGKLDGNKEVWPADITANRPGTPQLGRRFFDTTLGIPIWFDGTNWVDATGTTV